MSLLIVVGASVRAVAMSARSAGFDVAAVDMFGDADLQSIANVAVVPNYPHGLVEAIKPFDPGPWMYTGGIENYPKLVRRIAESRPLLGTPADRLVAARNPALLCEALQKADLPSPRYRPAEDPPPSDESWLVKPLRSAGGLGICPWHGTLPPGVKDHYFQSRIEGKPISAVFLGSPDGTMLLGITEQIIGATWIHSRGFQYCGSIGPLRLSPSTTEQCHRIGETFGRRFGLLGLFGVDAILRDGEIFPVEINPRFPASAEILERCSNWSAVQLHVDACCNASALVRPEMSEENKYWGKAIVFAPRNLNVDHRRHMQLMKRRGDSLRPEIADIPIAGTEIPQGRPFLTVFAEGTQREDVIDKLKSKADSILNGFA